jgi:hypothetical protein
MTGIASYELPGPNIEQVENVFGLVALAVCTVLVFAKRDWPSSEIRLFARGFFGIALLADFYWSLFTFVFGFTPPYFYVSELGWLAQELFLLLFLYEVYRRERGGRIYPVAWIGPVIIAALTVWFIVATGSPVINALTGIAMSGIALVAISALVDTRGSAVADRTARDAADNATAIGGASVGTTVRKPRRGLYAAALFFVVVEHIVWSCSVLDASVSFSNPYYWFAPLVPVSLIVLLVCFLHLGRPGEGDED